jgi:predicted nucleic acid-binding Zn ribbon protein
MKNRRNIRMMILLWAFALALCATVVILMMLRGPMR